MLLGPGYQPLSGSGDKYSRTGWLAVMSFSTCPPSCRRLKCAARGSMMGTVKRKIRCGGEGMTAIVLAGGRGRRMKADKAGLAVGDRTLLEHVLGQIAPYFDEILVSVSKGQELGSPPAARGKAGTGPARCPRKGRSEIRIVTDEIEDQGPIAGILAGLKAARHDACVVVACDIPDIDISLFRSLARAAGDKTIAVPVGPAGYYEPLFAVYRKSIVPQIEALLGGGERSILPLYDRCLTAVVRFKDAGKLLNLNTHADYETYLSSRSRRTPGRSGGQSGRRGRHGS